MENPKLVPEYQAFLDDLLEVFEKHGLCLEYTYDGLEIDKFTGAEGEARWLHQPMETPKSKADYHRKLIETQYKHSVDEYNDKKRAMDALAAKLSDHLNK